MPSPSTGCSVVDAGGTAATGPCVGTTAALGTAAGDVAAAVGGWARASSSSLDPLRLWAQRSALPPQGSA